MPIKIGLCISFCLFFQYTLKAQETYTAADTLAGADSVEITAQAFGINRLNLSTAVVRRHQFNQLESFGRGSLLPAINTMPGVRMEERSPGSYRLNIRGSSLRSPFGVRNVKMYWNDIPFTDAGGNTYFNQLALNSAQQLEIVRGPAGSMYGAGTGGLVLMNALSGVWKQGVNAEYSTGSFGTQNLLADISFGKKENKNRISYAHNQTDGYRSQSALRRDNIGWTSQVKASAKQQLTASVLFTDMYYETPGGLTQAEYNANPKAARPAAGGFPSAEQVNAAIWQKNLLAGITNLQKLDTHWTNLTSVYGGFALVKNSAIRNYETRSEPQLGGRTSFVYEKKNGHTFWKWQTGLEYQAGFFNTQVSRNKNGQRDSLLTNDDLKFNTGFLFTQLHVSLHDQWFITGGVSINQNKVTITRVSALPIVPLERTYQNEWAPRLQLTYRWKNNMETQATISRGFSPPTVSELLPSTGRISTDLEAETGYNYELAHSIRLFNSLQFTVNAFSFNLNNTLVQQRDASGGDYYINAGSTRQQGIESSAQYWNRLSDHNLIQSYNISMAYTYNDFEYKDYNKLGANYGGNKLPGVPNQMMSALAEVNFKMNLYVNFSYYYNSSIMLNDANTARAEPFHLLGARLGYHITTGKRSAWRVFAGADNLLNETYSLGNDINAAGNRFFNAAANRNWYAGISYGWHKNQL